MTSLVNELASSACDMDDDGAWHRVAVTKHGHDVYLYVDNAEVAHGLVDNRVGSDDVGQDFFAARFRCLPGTHDWFWHGSIRNVSIYDSVLECHDMFPQWVLAITAKQISIQMLRVTFRFVSGQSQDLEFEALSTLAGLRQQLDHCYEGIAQMVLISTEGDIYTEDYDLEEISFLPRIIEDVEMSITP